MNLLQQLNEPFRVTDPTAKLPFIIQLLFVESTVLNCALQSRTQMEIGNDNGNGPLYRLRIRHQSRRNYPE